MIIITGASKGIGKFLFDIYSGKRIDVIGTYNTSLHNLSNLTKLDVTDESQVKEFYQSNSLILNDITLINCAGKNANAITRKFETDIFREIIDVNVIGTFLMIKYALNYMREAGFGRIINFSSVVPQTGVPGTIAYSSSKSAIWGLTKTVAKENAKENITCNCLNLGYFKIGMTQDIPPKKIETILSSIPMNKFGDPINIYNAIEFLRASDYISGSSIDINGGLF
jgi:acetoacetyl-CoA reductase/3-oxoacyl-[acyl-carrier protein] reductase